MEQICRRSTVAGVSSGEEMVGGETRDTVDARELRDGKGDFADVWEAVEGRADRAALLPGILSSSQLY